MEEARRDPANGETLGGLRARVTDKCVHIRIRESVL